MKKIKATILILLTAITLFMMISTRYIGAIGDYVLSFLGIRPWTDINSGLHMTVIYFGIIFIICLVVIDLYVVKKLKFNWATVICSMFAFVVAMYYITEICTYDVKRNSNDLYAIEYNNTESILDYSYKNSILTELHAEITLNNLSNTDLKFFLSFDSPSYRKENIDRIDILDREGNRAEFIIKGNEQKKIEIDLNNYNIRGGRQFNNGGSQGKIREIVIENQDSSITICNNNSIGLLLTRG